MSENSICLFTTIRATLADTLAFVYYHLNIGVDHHYLFFDDPDDPSINVLAREKRVTCIRCDADHWRNHAGTFSESRAKHLDQTEDQFPGCVKISPGTGLYLDRPY